MDKVSVFVHGGMEFVSRSEMILAIEAKLQKETQGMEEKVQEGMKYFSWRLVEMLQVSQPRE